MPYLFRKDQNKMGQYIKYAKFCKDIKANGTVCFAKGKEYPIHSISEDKISVVKSQENGMTFTASFPIMHMGIFDIIEK